MNPDNDKTAFDYATPTKPTEPVHDPVADANRREAVAQYNQATFGERRPLRSSMVRLVLLLAVSWLLIVFLPRGIARLAAAIIVVGFIVWEANVSGRWPGGGSDGSRR